MKLVEYMGRMFDKDAFRVFVYGNDGDKKLAESWDDYKKLISTGIWFDTADIAKEFFSKDTESNKKKRRSKKDGE